ncbi:type IV toxin-antitoxin system AbiEi family antitoxin domain-containing protein [Streptomyces virginiae]|uniref:type IV toxin-antitoxin system AbiEi family antitoxin domain-containing protein n=1 Tax=Streptomyces virginiae TaxID=1961 RepID=UPI0035DE28C4
MERSEAIRRLGGIAADQWGLVTARQAQAAGLSRVDLGRLIEAELLMRAAHGIYQLAGGAPTPHVDIKAAWLRLDPGTHAWERPLDGDRAGVVSHASACQLHDIGDIPADDVQISVPVRRTTRESGVTLHKAAVPMDDVTLVDGLPVTTVDRTICDLLRSRADGGHVGRVLADADQRGLTDTRVLAERVQPYVRAYGLPKSSTGSDLLNFLAEQAGFTLRDEQLTTAGERAAINSAINPEAVLEVLRSHRPAAPPGMAATVEAVRAAQHDRWNSHRAMVDGRLVAARLAHAPGEAVRRALEDLALPRQSYLDALQQLLSSGALTAQLAGLTDMDHIRRLIGDLGSTKLAAAQIAALSDTTALADRIALLAAELPGTGALTESALDNRIERVALAGRPGSTAAESELEDAPGDPEPESGPTKP